MTWCGSSKTSLCVGYGLWDEVWKCRLVNVDMYVHVVKVKMAHSTYVRPVAGLARVLAD